MGCPSTVTLGDNLVFTVDTHNPSTGAQQDASGNVAYRLYEDETTVPILTGTMAKLDDVNTTGCYSEQIAATAGNGFEHAKSYSVRITATVGGVTGSKSYSFGVVSQDAADLNALLADGTYGLAALNTDLDALLARLTATRAGYLDNLSQAFTFDPSGNLAVNLMAIAGVTLASGDAVLALKQLVIDNDAGIGLFVRSTSANNPAAAFLGSGSGAGINSLGGATGPGALYTGQGSASGVQRVGGTTNGHGEYNLGYGTGAGSQNEGGNGVGTGHGIAGVGGDLGGAGIIGVGYGPDDAGLAAMSAGAGPRMAFYDVSGNATDIETSLNHLDADVSTRSTLTAQQVWEYTTRTLTAISDSAGITTLLTRIASALTITSGKVTVGTNDDKTGYTLTAAYDAAKTAMQPGADGDTGKTLSEQLDAVQTQTDKINRGLK